MGYPENKWITVIRAQDIQTGLQDYNVPYFDTLLRVGMASRLAIHIRGHDAIEYDLLKNVSSILLGIPRLVFDEILRVLHEVEFVRLIGSGSSRKVVPQVPYFDDLYNGLSEWAETQQFNELECLSIAILDRLAHGPSTKSELISEFDVSPQVANLILDLGRQGSYIDSFERSDGDEVLITPVYFSERPDELVQVIERYGTTSVAKVFEAIRNNAGWPLSLVQANSTIGGVTLEREEVQLVQLLVHRGILQPPEITTKHSGTNFFLFTPPIGNERIPVVEKALYEKAMAIIAIARQGQHFARYRILWPRAVINALLRDKWLRPTSEAGEQWKLAVMLGICKLVPRGSWHEVHLIETEDNVRAVRLALQLMDVGDVMEERGLDRDAQTILERQALYDVDQSAPAYGESLIGLTRLRRRRRPQVSRDVIRLVDGLLERIQKG